MYVENSPMQMMHADLFKIVFLYLDRNTELAQAVDIVMMA